MTSSSYTTSVAESLRRLQPIVSSRCGIVSELLEPALSFDDPNVTITLSRPNGSIALHGRKAVSEGAGASLDRNLAQVKALAESVERYCASFQPPDLQYGTFDEIDSQGIDPSTFALFDSAQYAGPDFPYVPFDRKTRTQWTEGTQLGDGASRMVPAPFVYLPYQRKIDEPRIFSSISTGLATGTSPSAAKASALREVIERDAFMLVWRKELDTPELDLSTVPVGKSRELIGRLADCGVSCRVRVLSQDIAVPVLLVILRKQSGIPFAALAAGTHGNVDTALLSALEEACLSLFGLNRLVQRHKDEIKDLADEQLTTLALQSVSYAISEARCEQASFLLGPTTNITSLSQLQSRFKATEGGSLGSLIDALGPWQTDAVTVDCTTSDIADLGLHVERAIVPGLLPLDHNNAFQHRGGIRLLRDHSLNFAPHPFP